MNLMNLMNSMNLMKRSIYAHLICFIYISTCMWACDDSKSSANANREANSQASNEGQSSKPKPATVDPKYLQAYQSNLNASKDPLSSLYQQGQPDQEAPLRDPLPKKWIQFVDRLKSHFKSVLVQSWKFEQTAHFNPKNQGFEINLQLQITDTPERVEKLFLSELKNLIPQATNEWPKNPIEFGDDTLSIQVSKLVSEGQKQKKHVIAFKYLKSYKGKEELGNCRQILGLNPPLVDEWMGKAFKNNGDKKLIQVQFEQKGKQGEWYFLLQYRNGSVRDEWVDFWATQLPSHQFTLKEQKDFYQAWHAGSTQIAWWSESSAPEMGCEFGSSLMGLQYRLP
jgi:hypothetical protein